jgi:hypothetical protein
VNAKRVNAAAGVIHASQVAGKQTATGLAADLESACMLQSPETAAELAAYRALELGDLDGRVSASCGKPHHPTWLRAADDTRGCPWCEIDGAHEETIGANLARWEEEQENARLRLAWQSARGRAAEQAADALTFRRATAAERKQVRELEARVAELEAERHVTNEALDDAVQELRSRSEVAPLKGRARLDASAADAAEATHWRRLGVEDPHDSPLHRTYKVPHDLPETGGAR